MKQVIETFISIFSISAVRYFIVAGIPFLVFYWLCNVHFQSCKIQNGNAKRKDFKREIWHSMQSTLIFSVYGYLVLFTPFRTMTKIYSSISEFPIWYIPVSLLACFILHDTYFYWMHRLLHHKLVFRFAHLLHHRSVNPSPWTSYSFHLIEGLTEGGILVVITLLLPLHEVTIILFTVGGFVINVYGHLGYEILPQRFRSSFLFNIFNSSIYHNMHHSKFKGNYGLYFRGWDRLMKTEHPEYVKEYDRIQKQRFG